MALKPHDLQGTVLLLATTKPVEIYVTEAIPAEYRELRNGAAAMEQFEIATSEKASPANRLMAAKGLLRRTLLSQHSSWYRFGETGAGARADVGEPTRYFRVGLEVRV